MSQQDALLLNEALGADDVSMAWVAWSRAAESALLGAYRFSGGPLPSRGLVLGRVSAMFRVVRLGDHKVRKVRGNAVDVHDAADVFLFRDSSISPLLDMRRRFKAVMDVLDAVIRSGISLSRSVLSGIGFLLLSLYILFLLMIFMRFRVWVLVISFVLFLVFIVDLVILFISLWFIAGMRLLGVA